jgi:hypothetical protein
MTACAAWGLDGHCAGCQLYIRDAVTGKSTSKRGQASYLRTDTAFLQWETSTLRCELLLVEAKNKTVITSADNHVIIGESEA